MKVLVPERRPVTLAIGGTDGRSIDVAEGGQGKVFVPERRPVTLAIGGTEGQSIDVVGGGEGKAPVPERKDVPLPIGVADGQLGLLIVIAGGKPGVLETLAIGGWLGQTAAPTVLGPDGGAVVLGQVVLLALEARAC